MMNNIDIFVHNIKDVSELKKKIYPEFEFKVSNIDYNTFFNLSPEEQESNLLNNVDLCRFENIVYWDVECPTFRENVFPDNNDFCKYSRVKSIAFIRNNVKYIVYSKGLTVLTRLDDINYIETETPATWFLTYITSLPSVCLIGYNSSSKNLDYLRKEQNEILDEEEDDDLGLDYVVENCDNNIFNVGYDFAALLRSYMVECNYLGVECEYNLKCEYVYMKGVSAVYQAILKWNNIYMLDLLPYISWKFARAFKQSDYLTQVGIFKNKLDSWAKYYFKNESKIDLEAVYLDGNSGLTNVEIITRQLGSLVFNSINEVDASLVLEYNMMDVILLEKIFDKLDRFSDISILMNVLNIPFRMALASNSRISNFIMLRELYHNKEYIRHYDKVCEFDQVQPLGVAFQGSIVNNPIPGYHHIQAYVDYASLYPSVIIEKNICQTTYIGYILNGVKNIFVRNVEYHRVCIDDNLVTCFRKDIIGLIPKQLLKYFTIRSIYKNIIRSNNNTFLKAGDSSIKLCMNSTYGWFGFKKGLFYKLPVAISVTAAAREMKLLSEKITLEIGLRISGGDTDSNMLDSLKNDKKYKEDTENLLQKTEVLTLDEWNKLYGLSVNNVNSDISRNVGVKITNYINDKLRENGVRYCMMNMEDVNNSFYFPGLKKRYTFSEKGVKKIKGFQKSKFSNFANKLIVNYIHQFSNNLSKDDIKELTTQYIKDIIGNTKYLNNNNKSEIFLIEHVTDKNIKTLQTKHVLKNGFYYISSQLVDNKYELVKSDKERYVNKIINRTSNLELGYLYCLPLQKSFMIDCSINSENNEISIDIKRCIFFKVLQRMLTWFGFTLDKKNVRHILYDSTFDFSDSKIDELSEHVANQLTIRLTEAQVELLNNSALIPGSRCTELRNIGYEAYLSTDGESRINGEYNEFINYYGLSLNCGYQPKRNTLLIGLDIDCKDSLGNVLQESVTMDVLKMDMFTFGSYGRKGRHLFVELKFDDNGYVIVPNAINNQIHISSGGEIELKGLKYIRDNGVVRVPSSVLYLEGRHRTYQEFVFERFGTDIPIISAQRFYEILNNENLYYKEEELKNNEIKNVDLQVCYYRIQNGKLYGSINRDSLNNDNLESVCMSNEINNGNGDSTDNINVEYDVNILNEIKEMLYTLTYENVYGDYSKMALLNGYLFQLLNKREYIDIIIYLQTLDEFKKVNNKERKLVNKYSNVNLLLQTNKYFKKSKYIFKRVKDIKFKMESIPQRNAELINEEFRSEHYSSDYSHVIIKSHMGSGKTSMLFNYLRDYIDRYQLVFVTSRVSQIHGLNEYCYSKYGFFGCKIMDKCMFKKDEKVYLVQFESLSKVKLKELNEYILIVDEFDGLFYQVTGDLNKKYKEHNLNMLVELYTTAFKTYTMDAFILNWHIDIFKKYISNDYKYIINDYRRLFQKGYYYESQNDFFQSLIRDLRGVDKIAICCDNKKLMFGILINIISKFKKKVVVICGARKKMDIGAGAEEYEEKCNLDYPSNHFVNRHKIGLSSSKYLYVDTAYHNSEYDKKYLDNFKKMMNYYPWEADIVLYTGVITHTINMDDRSFNAVKVYSYFNNYNLSPLQKIQMTGRCRNAIERHIFNKEVKNSRFNKKNLERGMEYFKDYNMKMLMGFVKRSGNYDRNFDIYKDINIGIAQMKSLGLTFEMIKSEYNEFEYVEKVSEIGYLLEIADYENDEEDVDILKAETSNLCTDDCKLDLYRVELAKILLKYEYRIPRNKDDKIMISNENKKLIVSEYLTWVRNKNIDIYKYDNEKVCLGTEIGMSRYFSKYIEKFKLEMVRNGDGRSYTLFMCV